VIAVDHKRNDLPRSIIFVGLRVIDVDELIGVVDLDDELLEEVVTEQSINRAPSENDIIELSGRSAIF
jgi:hypothetical protein